MRKDWWLIIILVACFALLVVVLFWDESIKDDINQGDSNLVGMGDDFDIGSDDSVATSGGGGSGLGDESEGIDDEDGGGFIPDISGVECGFYFEEYGVCNGTCPDGECVSEGRSCYCKS